MFDLMMNTSVQSIVPAVHSPGNDTQFNREVGETQPSGSGLQLIGSGMQHSGSELQLSGRGKKSRK